MGASAHNFLVGSSLRSQGRGAPFSSPVPPKSGLGGRHSPRPRPRLASVTPEPATSTPARASRPRNVLLSLAGQARDGPGDAGGRDARPARAGPGGVCVRGAPARGPARKAAGSGRGEERGQARRVAAPRARARSVSVSPTRSVWASARAPLTLSGDRGQLSSTRRYGAPVAGRTAALHLPPAREPSGAGERGGGGPAEPGHERGGGGGARSRARVPLRGVCAPPVWPAQPPPRPERNYLPTCAPPSPAPRRALKGPPRHRPAPPSGADSGALAGAPTLAIPITRACVCARALAQARGAAFVWAAHVCPRHSHPRARAAAPARRLSRSQPRGPARLSRQRPRAQPRTSTHAAVTLLPARGRGTPAGVHRVCNCLAVLT